MRLCRRLQSSSMTSDRIRKLLAPFLRGELSEHQLQLVSTYLELLLKWNAKTNLTAIRDPEEIVTRHLGESFFSAQILLPDHSASNTVIDVGSGAGFPGLPAKILAPGIQLTLVEAHQKKAVFLREAIRALGLGNAQVLAERAENVRIDGELVMLRAVERFQEVLPVAAKLVSKGGRLALLVGSGQVDSAKILLPDIAWQTPTSIPLSTNRVLLIGRVSAEPRPSN